MRPRGQLEWRLSRTHYLRFMDLLEQIRDRNSVQADTSDLKEDIRALPGFPAGADDQGYDIVPIVTTL